MSDLEFQGEAESNRCAHCHEKIVVGDRCLVYIDPNKKPEVKMMVHDRCAPEFFGKGVH